MYQEKIQKLTELFLEENNKINLSSFNDKETIVKRHIEDSLTILDFLKTLKFQTIVDAGTGGGFPGLPLSIYLPEKSFTLIDSVNKKLISINKIIQKLDLNNVKTLHSRIEEYRVESDICIFRALAPLNVSIELCWHLVKINGYMIMFIGSQQLQEIKNHINKHNIPGELKILDDRFLVIKKISNLEKIRTENQIRKKGLFTI